MLDLEETAKQEENEENDNKTDTHSSDSKDDNTKKEDKINTDSSEKSQDKRKEDTRQESKSDQEATGDNKEPTEQQPREEEGNKDPGGVKGAQTPASDGDTDNSQRALNGECLSFQICWYFTFAFIPISGIIPDIMFVS